MKFRIGPLATRRHQWSSFTHHLYPFQNQLLTVLQWRGATGWVPVNSQNTYVVSERKVTSLGISTHRQGLLWPRQVRCIAFTFVKRQGVSSIILTSVALTVYKLSTFTTNICFTTEWTFVLQLNLHTQKIPCYRLYFLKGMMTLQGDTFLI